ncbi:glycosyltransferase [Neisseria canis]|uniref:Glycosyltransferase n=2 Tax=Neisseria canis TaxID=493 RepID=A0A3S4NMW9_9NEIS|nr:glycosyltransferase [Neisseria canis]
MDISIIVPCYNAIGKIEACIASLQKIEYPASQYEVIFVDDCSTDHTLSHLKEQVASQSNWKVLQMPQNSGSPSEPRNLGVSQAVGKYVFFLDCDDEILSDTLNIHFQTAKEHNADIVRGYLIVDDGNKRSIANRIQGNISGLDKRGMIETIISKQSTTVPSMIKRELLNQNQIKWRSDLRIGEDTLYLSDVFSVAENIVYIDHPTFVYNKKINEEASSTQNYGSRELKNHIIVWQTAQEKLSKQGVDYYQIRLQVGLQTAIQSMITYNRFDISESDFIELADFINQQRRLVETFNYSERIKSVLNEIYSQNYNGFLNAIKQRMVVAGYDLKFIKPVLPTLEQFYQIRIDEWTGHNAHNEQHSEDCLQWAEIIFCEWMLGNAVWYSQRVRTNQKLFIRMHRFELTTQWFKQIDFTKVNRVFAVSLYFFEKLVEYTRIPRAQACLLPNYLDSENYEQSNNKEKLFNLGIIGILPSRKGYLNALKVLKQLVETNKKYKLFVYGKMPEDLSWVKNNQTEMAYFDECKRYIQQNNLQKSVVVKGWVDVRTELKDIGFILSTSDNEEIPESFHIAPADGFSAGNQGLLLNWNGVEYIYPEKYIFDSINSMADHINRQNNLAKFDLYKQQGIELIKDRYSVEYFVRQLRKQIHLSAARFAYAPAPIAEAFEQQQIAEIQNRKLTAETIAIDLPKDAQSDCKLILEYNFKLSENIKVNAALVALKSANSEPVSGFKPSDIKEIGLYKYLDTTQNDTACFLEIPLSGKNKVEQLKLVLWQKDAEIELQYLKAFRF